MEYECLTIYDKSIYKPKFEFSIEDSIIKFNTDEWFKNFQDNVTETACKITEKLPFDSRTVEYNKLLNLYNEANLKGSLNLSKNIDFMYNKATKTIPKAVKLNNPHPRFFVNEYAFNLFERLRETVTNPLADYSFFYRKMINDNLIYKTVGDSEFRQWLSQTYQIEIDKTKQLHICTTNSKEELYSTIKDLIKQS